MTEDDLNGIIGRWMVEALRLEAASREDDIGDEESALNKFVAERLRKCMSDLEAYRPLVCAQQTPGTTFNADESYNLFLILDTLSRSLNGHDATVNAFRERLLPVYRDWHKANPHRAHPSTLPSPPCGTPEAKP